jgi:hypothetical protein
MLAAVSKLAPLAAQITRQVVPAVVATLIAAGLIAAYNRAFSGHLQQPRMAAMHAAAGMDDDAPATVVSVAKPAAPAPVATYDNLLPPQRLWDKEARQDAGKDQTPIKTAAEPIPALVRAAQALHAEPKTEPRVESKVEPKIEPKIEPRPEPRRVATAEPPQSVARAPAPVIVTVPPSVVAPLTAAPAAAAMPGAQDQRPPVYPTPSPQPQYAQPSLQPPPVITAQPMVTVPDKPRPVIEAQAEPPAPPQGMFGKVVDTLKPGNLLARAREFGEKIEAAGNDLLPNIRQ